MTYKNNCPSFFMSDILHLTNALLLKFRISDCKYFINNQYIGIKMRCYENNCPALYR